MVESSPTQDGNFFHTGAGCFSILWKGEMSNLKVGYSCDFVDQKCKG